MTVLGVGVVAIVSAATREARLEAGEMPGAAARRRGRRAGAVAACLVITGIWLGNAWWRVEAARYDRYVYKPLQAATSVSAEGTLTLALHDPGWIATRRLDDFVPDHDHVMHLFVVSPDLNRFWHLHPDWTASGSFTQSLPEIPPGPYELFADLVHATGISETVTARLDLPAITGTPLAADDSAASIAGAATATSSFSLPDGGRVIWVRDARPLRTKQLTMFTFRVDDATGQPATDMELYMGMPGHAVFVRRDRQVFAHVHRSGRRPWPHLPSGWLPYPRLSHPVSRAGKRITSADDRSPGHGTGARSRERPSGNCVVPVWLSRARRLPDLRAGQASRSDRNRGVRRIRRRRAILLLNRAIGDLQGPIDDVEAFSELSLRDRERRIRKEIVPAHEGEESFLAEKAAQGGHLRSGAAERRHRLTRGPIPHELDDTEEANRTRRADGRMVRGQIGELLFHHDAHPSRVGDQIVFLGDSDRRECRRRPADGCCR
jgi:hypothetical protein